MACAMTDFDNDNDVDVYIANDFGHFVEPNELYENQYPDMSFNNISDVSGADIGLFGMGIAIGDYDNDLDLDYYVTNLGKNELLQNNGNKTFSKVTNYAQVGDSAVIGEGLAVGWGTGFFDYDNNGWLDLYISNGFIPSANELDNPEQNPNAIYQPAPCHIYEQGRLYFFPEDRHSAVHSSAKSYKQGSKLAPFPSKLSRMIQ